MKAAHRRHNHKRLIGVLAALTICIASLAGFGIANALTGPPPVTLSPGSGAAGTTFTVTLPAPCTVPTGDPANPDALDVNFSNESYTTYLDQSYPGTAGVPITSVVFGVPAGTAAGHYVVSAICNVAPDAQAPIYGNAYFTVTGGPTLPALTVSPGSAAPGSTIDVSGTCSPGAGQPSATLFVTIASATDPNVTDSAAEAGTGPVLTAQLLVVGPPGTYFITATCNTYVTVTQFAEVPFAVTGTAGSVSLATTLAGAGASGSSITVAPDTPVSDSVVFSGPNVSDASGYLTYSVFSNSTCTDYVATGGAFYPFEGQVSQSNPVSLPVGTYYWQVYYSGDNTNEAVTATCGSEVETVGSGSSSTSLTGSLSGGGNSGPTVSVPPGTPVTDAATLSGTNASSAGGTVTYTVYSDDACTTSVDSGGTVTVSDGKVPSSSSVAITAPGTYYWQASYSGDATNAASKSTCGSEVEAVKSSTSATSATTSKASQKLKLPRDRSRSS